MVNFFRKNGLVPGDPVFGNPFHCSVIFVGRFHFESTDGIMSDNDDDVSHSVVREIILLNHNVVARIHRILKKDNWLNINIYYYER